MPSRALGATPREAGKRRYSTISPDSGQMQPRRVFGLGHLEPLQGRGGMTEEHVPVALADAHPSVGERHVPAAVVHRSARDRAEEVNQELFLAH